MTEESGPGADREHATPASEVPEPRPDLLARLKEHKVLQWALAYLGAALAIGEAGAKNAGLFAAEILALHDDKLRSRLLKWRARQTNDALASTPKVQR